MKDIPIFMEILSLFGLICCLFIFNASLTFLIILISFVLCEIIIEWLGLKLASWLAILYKLSFIIAVGVTAIKENGMQLSSIFAVFFIFILLILPHETTKLETSKG